MACKRRRSTDRTGAIKLVKAISPEATPSEAQRIYRLMRQPKRNLVSMVLMLRSEIRLLNMEAAALRALERRETLIPPAQPISADAAIARQHLLLKLGRQYTAGYRPSQHQALKHGG